MKAITNLNPRESTMLSHFADASRKTSGYIMKLKPYDTTFVVMPVWGQPNHMVGVLYQNKITEEHCDLMRHNVNPNRVDMRLPRGKLTISERQRSRKRTRAVITNDDNAMIQEVCGICSVSQ
jgi:hypothetical protein